MAETVDTKPTYRTAYDRRRRLVPANGWYEWRTTPSGKRPWYFKPKQGELLAFAGIWERSGQGDQAFNSYSIIVTRANELAKQVHNRMPVVLGADDFAVWLDPETQQPERLKPLVARCPPEWLEAYPVSPRVNNPKNDEAALVRPV